MLGWLAAVGALALDARRRGAPRREWIFIGLAAVFLLDGPFPAGTRVFGYFFVAVLLREFTVSSSDLATHPALSPVTRFWFVRPDTRIAHEIAILQACCARGLGHGIGPRSGLTRLCGQHKCPFAGTSRDGSDGTRTRDLRRDRPAF